MRCLGRSIVAVALLTAPAVANDGYMGLSAGGLAFEKSDAIVMAEEDLTISPSKISVRYVFRNVSAVDVTAWVGFPMPPLRPAAIDGDMPIAPELMEARGTDPFRFSTAASGAPVAAAAQVRAILTTTGLEAGYSLLAQESADVTAQLQALDIPLTFELPAIMERIAQLSAEDRARLAAEKILDDSFGDGRLLPAWALAVTYRWQQTFRAGEETVIEHSYRPIPAGSVFYVGEDIERDYCMGSGEKKVVQRFNDVIGRDDAPFYPDMRFVDYVVTTANSWSGPIGRFRLVIDKEKPDALVSLCLDGDIRKETPTTFVAERTNFTPKQDLRLLFITPRPVPKN